MPMGSPVPDSVKRLVESTAVINKQTDALVYELYGLTDKEIATVEGRGREHDT
jgi:hypothetical protein